MARTSGDLVAAPNDTFANATLIWNGRSVNYDISGGSVETGEAGGMKRSIWYKWIADDSYTATFVFSAAYYNSFGVNVYQESDDATDYLANIKPVYTTAPNATGGISPSFAAVAGAVYYIQVGAYTATAVTPFTMAYPAGRPSAPRAADGSNDLPGFLAGTVHPTFNGLLVEAVGYGPLDEKATTQLNLLADDEHSDSPYAPTSVLVRNSDGTPSTTCERWVRLQFEPPFGAITKVRFWIDNYDPSSGWGVRYGVSDIYVPPSLDTSNIAVFDAPTSDPGVGNIDLEITAADGVYSKWLVLQATWSPGESGPIQSTPLNWKFAWTEA